MNTKKFQDADIHSMEVVHSDRPSALYHHKKSYSKQVVYPESDLSLQQKNTFNKY